jgi:glutamate N-acetyltransferase/amino-acid N-acetyltransferase
MSLTLQLQSDAEGVSKEVFITTIHASSVADAEEVGRACARNNLLKCALHGEDPNWGRVLAAVGTARVPLNPLDIDVTLNGIEVAKSSAPFADRNQVSFTDRLVTIDIDLKLGKASATVFTNDLSHDYVHENSAYAT